MPTHLDFETTSACDIDLGAFRYAEDESTRILMFAVSTDDGPIYLWDFLDPLSSESLNAWETLQKAVHSGDTIYAHNAQFEMAVSNERLRKDVGIDPPGLGKWRCSQAMCRRAAAPESLANAAKFFNLGDLKNPVGKALIHIFSDQTIEVTLEAPPGSKDPATVKKLKHGGFSAGCKPANRKSFSPVLDEEILWDWRVKVDGTPMTVLSAWEMFKDYCRQDVVVERKLHAHLSHFELKGDILEWFLWDMRMNARGVPVNIQALKNAEKIVNALTAKLSARFTTLCGLEPTQREKVQKWLQERGYPADNMQAATVDEILESPPPEMTKLAVEVLRMRSLIMFSALAKIPTMLASAGRDGRIRGTLQWHSARTGRAGGRLLQPQNMKKATISDSELCYRMLCEGWDPIWFEEFWESPLEAIASSIRHFIQPPDTQFYDADFSQVEAMLVAWAVGDWELLDAICKGVDLYKRMAVRIFKVIYEQVNKDQRTISKPVVLGCGFGGSGRSIQEALAKPPYNVVRTRAECNEYVAIYRETHPHTVKAWSTMENAAKAAIQQPGCKFHGCNMRIAFNCGRAAGVDYLVMTLPSGRKLYYPNPKIERKWVDYDEEEMKLDERKREKGGYWRDEISFYGKIQKTGQWGRIHTWGSRLLENAIQAMGADLLHRGCIEAEKRGYPITMVVHDQALSEVDPYQGNLEGFIDALCTRDKWAADFPLRAAGEIHPYYLKAE